jgi:hypothetical protein
MSTVTRKQRPQATRTQLSDIACLMGLVAITVVFWTLVALGLVLLF